ncbi:Zn(2)-C6 fungal-type domain-containing protein [Mycena chlorophos]|uniref:Zn(2)-C6 fungal-type domain-containing protein n=1 Tax=Mycena chlorophos TaxID=658473 RepID=A0A8H6SCE5_MYCCL|nr:Zn(2)-C6 fungal-type domain-containing protein [Mycena chlorophos]
MSQGNLLLSSVPLQRGKACLSCRRRKTKCDSTRPICGPCSRNPNFADDCEYDDEGPADSQILEEQIRILQQRINELQNPAGRRSGHGSRPNQLSSQNQMPLGPLLSYFHSQQTAGANLDAFSAMAAELPPIVLQALAHNFLHNASSFGFFLNAQAFHDAIQHPVPQSPGSLPVVLLNVMHLWGIHLSTDARLARYEPALLAHSLNSTASSLTSTHPRTLLHGAQAEVLLATYFFRNGRIVEGRYHISAAIGIVLSGRWNMIRPGAAGSAEELRAVKEQIAAFWGVLTLDSIWAGVHDWAPNVIPGVPGGLDVETPWPAENLQQSGTLARFLAGLPDHPDSLQALQAKAGVLLASAATAEHRAAPDIVLDRRISTFTAALPPIQSKPVLVVHLLARVAIIRLHAGYGSSESRGKMLNAARDVLRLLTNPAVAEEVKGGVIDPIIAPILTRTCNVLISELAAANSAGTPAQPLSDSLKFLVHVMQVMAPQFKLMATNLAAVRELCNAARIILA